MLMKKPLILGGFFYLRSWPNKMSQKMYKAKRPKFEIYTNVLQLSEFMSHPENALHFG
jgi:hypothetical protein